MANEMFKVGRHPRSPQAPWDPISGLRVGAFTGGVLGGLGALMTDPGNAWWVVLGGAIGGAVGYWSERRKQQRGAAE